MATKFIDLTGTVKWAKVRKPDDKYNNWTVNFYPDDRSWKIFQDSGLQIRPKEDEDGKFVIFRRPAEKVIKSELVKFNPPKVWDASNQPFDGIIGNGSSATVKVAVYDTVKGKGHRWEAIRVDKLVEYVPPETAATGSNSGESTGASAPKPLPF